MSMVTENNKYLFFFPDLYQMFYIKNIIPKEYQSSYLIIDWIIKIYIEFIQHYKKH
jgi:hypothetical protein